MRLTAYVELYGTPAKPLENVRVTFEISGEAATPLLSVAAERILGDGFWKVARAELPLDGVAHGNYVARARIEVAGQQLGTIVRPFTYAPP
jgi:hypothetical protein